MVLSILEIRTNNSYEAIDYSLLKVDDIISFQIINGPPFINLDVITPDALKVKVKRVTNYRTPEELLLNEGASSTLYFSKFTR